MNLMPSFLASSWAILASLSTGHCVGGEARDGVPGALEGYVEQYEVSAARDLEVEGVALYRITPRVLPADADSTARLVGVDAEGRLVERAALVGRAGARTAPELARLVREAILARPGDALAPGDAALALDSVRPGERALVEAPSLEGGTLTFFGVEGSMHPELYRYRTRAPAFAIERERASELAAAAACAAFDGSVSIVTVRWEAADRVALADGVARVESRIPLYDDGIDDLVVAPLADDAQPDCSSYGDCVKAVLLACGDDRYAVVVAPDYHGSFAVAEGERSLGGVAFRDLVETARVAASQAQEAELIERGEPLTREIPFGVTPSGYAPAGDPAAREGAPPATHRAGDRGR